MKKRIISLFLAILMVVTSMPASVFANGTVTYTTDYSANKGGTAVFNPDLDSYAYIAATPSDSWTNAITVDQTSWYELVFVIDEVYVGDTGYWYKLSAATGYDMPSALFDSPWVYQNDLPTGTYADALIVTPPTSAPSEPELPAISGTVIDSNGNPVTDADGNPLVITVQGDLPEGAEVRASVPEINGEKLPNVFDIKVVVPNAEGQLVEWQPIDEGKTVTLSIPIDTNAEFVDVVHFIDCKNAITKAMQVTSVKDIPIESVPFLNPAIEAYGDGSHIAFEMFNDARVENGRVNIECSSFSIYQLTDNGFIPAENQDGNVPIDNSEAGDNDRLTYYASPGTTFNMTTENMTIANKPFSLEGTYSSGVTLENVDYILWKGAKVTVNEVNAGDVITVKFKGWSYTYYVDIHIVREVTVAYDANSKTATGMPDPLSKVIATDGTIQYKIPDGKPTAANCAFKGWALNNAGTGTLYQPGAEFTLVGDLTFYAIWEEDKFDVSFNHNYKIGDNVPKVEVMEDVQHGTVIEFPAPPYRENYTFLGWCASSNGQGDKYNEGDKLTVTSAATYFAIWGADLTVTISGNIAEIKMMEGTEQDWKNIPGGYFSQAGNSYNREDVEGFLKGTTFRIKAGGDSNFSAGAGKAYTSTGAAVTFWTEDGGKTLFVQLPNGVTVDTSITITTEKDKFTVSYVPNGGTAVAPDEGVTSGSHINPNDKTTTREGYTLDGWYSDAALTQKVTGAVQITAHTTFYAKWSADDFTITYDLDNGVLPEGKINPEKYNAETEDFTLNNPTKEGYIFAGWTGTGLTQAAMTVTISKGSTGKRNYTATWMPITYNINYVLTNNGVSGIGHGDNPASYTVESGLITLKDPTPPEGYRFVRWEEGNTIPAGSTGDKTFTAVWELALADLTIQVSGNRDADQSYVFVVKDSADKAVANVVIPVGKTSVTVKNLPVGTYRVTPVSGWAWRQSYTVNNDGQVELTGNKTVEFKWTFIGNLIYWLNGYGYNKRGAKG